MMQTITQYLAAVRTGALTARAAVEQVLERIARYDRTIGAFLQVRAAAARAAADAVDARRARGATLGPLAGLPIGIKDAICEQDVECTCASRILRGYRPPYDATVIARLRAADAIPIGRLNMDEFAMGSSTEQSAMQPTRNPWDPTRVPGGSSGGSAAAVAARFVPMALGSDSGGSIRQPAAFCGVCGLKPTYGRVSRYGLVAYASSLDQIGPLALSVEDIALVLPFLAGHDPRDATAADVPVPDYRAALTGDIRGLRIGVPKEYFVAGVDTAVQQSVRAAIDTLCRLGATAEDISLPHTEYAVAAHYIVATAEASSNLARFDGIHYGARAADAANLDDVYCKTRRELLGDEAIRRIMLGTYVLSAGYYDAYYLKALKVRTLIKQDFDAAFRHVDLIVTPTSPTPAFALGERTRDPLQMYLADIFTVSVNLAGIPGLSIPCGCADATLPVGMQLLAKPFAEATLLRAGHAYQTATDFHLHAPVLSA